ncbi:MAG: transcription elongation factor GreA [uncultured bacterium]|nr:MAG: transcription elongation factor GreA [uncultured bacterium]OGT16207.1 MAG: transcription elongation factor GreA [Gammaproteobacteria bacterium RIFCSPHIGHO2_02_FULL_38_33]OGT24173.1 MAG: transcription elongation factor GreA [Gammaproteobacteria bacterium RIFCSPHIGHO2_12_38_15]OGT69623.1 MAG: transcription elongation factor GreA [Gammaproteobacteria bacterium RIFCSPLOWO2_02_FULL_38_11]OGT75472.1 MAG: transcription elongation factor GreA [Gammaproteobacteria bacterium RIFCSPLOWO2_12_FULL_3
MSKVPMTVQGSELLKKELHHLKTGERYRIINAISEARALGDLKENAEYHAAKEQQGFIEGRIVDLESKLSNAQVIDISKMKNQGRVIFGSTVTLLNISTDQKVKYQIVGEDEADLKALKLSHSSPLARAAMGKEVNDIITVQAPSGNIEYEIIQVEYL